MRCNVYRPINPRVCLNVRLPEACACATCDRRDQSTHELAPLAAPSSANAFTRVYINVIAAGSNSFFPPSRGSSFPSVRHGALLDHYESKPSAAATYTISQRTASTSLPLVVLHAHLFTRETPGAVRLTRARTCTRTRTGAGVLRLSTDAGNGNARSEHGRAVARQVLTEGTRNRSCGPGGTRFTDPSCERRYRYLHRPISSGRLIGSAREIPWPGV